MKAVNNLQTLKGFRDFLPAEAIKRKYLIEKISKVFEKYGFDPLETPALEYAEILLGKYGEDADKLIYSFEDRGGRKIGLRYDQTVPTARVVGQYSEILPKPFKRYQIQNVWRSENTQKGRYREFLQCDADVIGKTDVYLADAEVLAVFYEIYQAIGIKNLKIIINSRQLLSEMIGRSISFRPTKNDEFLTIVRSLDKLDKIGEGGVRKELMEKEIPNLDIDNLFTQINEKQTMSFKELNNAYGNIFYSVQIATENFGVPESAITFSPTLARGLDYYTGIIFEAVSEGVKGSLGGGGRYDKLISDLGGPTLPACGFAIGFDRTLELAGEQKLIPEKQTVTRVLVTYLDDGKNVYPEALKLTGKLRQKGVNTEIFLDPKEKELGKQVKYAESKGIPYVIIIKPEKIEVLNREKDFKSELTFQEILKMDFNS